MILHVFHVSLPNKYARIYGCQEIGNSLCGAWSFAWLEGQNCMGFLACSVDYSTELFTDFLCCCPVGNQCGIDRSPQSLVGLCWASIQQPALKLY